MRWALRALRATLKTIYSTNLQGLLGGTDSQAPEAGEAEEVAQLEKVPCEHVGPSSDPQNRLKSQAWLNVPVIPILRGRSISKGIGVTPEARPPPDHRTMML